MKLYKISIIIPFYKVEQYIERCLLSVFAQTYSGPMECILVDDASPDDSMSICSALLEKYDGDIEFKILRHSENRGISAARNTGLDASTGEYVFYIDSDDDVSPDCIELLVSRLNEYPESEMVMGNQDTDKENIDLDIRPYFRHVTHVLGNRDIRRCCAQQGIPVMAWNKLMSRKFLVEHKIRYKDGFIHEDLPFLYDLKRSLTEISIVPEITYHYRENLTGITSSTDKAESMRVQCLIALEELPIIDKPFQWMQFLNLTRIYSWGGIYGSPCEELCKLKKEILKYCVKHLLPIEFMLILLARTKRFNHKLLLFRKFVLTKVYRPIYKLDKYCKNC